MHVPDPEVYWYHPHIREDYGQEMGLYGNTHVVLAEPDYWPPVNRELFLTLDDILIEDGKIAGFSSSETTHVAMGRFGNVMLVSGDPTSNSPRSTVRFSPLLHQHRQHARVQRDAARSSHEARGGDSGHYEHESFVEEVLLSPSERFVVDVLFEQPGEHVLEHCTPARSYRLASITVEDAPAELALGDQFGVLRTNETSQPSAGASPIFSTPLLTRRLPSSRRWTPTYLREPSTRVRCIQMSSARSRTLSSVRDEAPPDGVTLDELRMPDAIDVTSDSPDRCPECGMKLVPAHLVDTSDHGGHDMHAAHVEHHDHPLPCGAPGPRSRRGSPARARSGNRVGGRHGGGEPTDDASQHALEARRPRHGRCQRGDRLEVPAGDEIKIRLVNEMDSDHPMPHPFHVHGAGRFLVLARDGLQEPNLAWKDTVLVRTGETVDILLDVTNPAGGWPIATLPSITRAE